MASDPPTSSHSRSNRIWIALLVAIALLTLLAMRRSLGKAMRMTTETTTSASPTRLKPGEAAKFVLQVTTVAGTANAGSSEVEGIVLEKQTETFYRRTGSTVKIGFDPATPVVMGKIADVREGSVVFIKAKEAETKMGETNKGEDRLQAEQIVILTGYVTVR
jgi:hypothetical protein